MEKESTPERPSGQTYDLSGMFSLALRLVVGWTYFSAFWRRLVLFRDQRKNLRVFFFKHTTSSVYIKRMPYLLPL